MARIARVVAQGYPHHITQRGIRDQKVFFSDEDYELYLDLLAEWCGQYEVDVWSYCLMPNHVHLMVVPHSPDGLARAIGETHRRYTRFINLREGWRGYLWQGRFASFPMDRPSALACARYIELNPVRAKLVKRPQQWHWSSARAHLKREYGPLIRSAKPLRNYKEWATLLKGGLTDADAENIRRCQRTGRPLGSVRFLNRLEELLDRPLKKQKPGPKPKAGPETKPGPKKKPGSKKKTDPKKKSDPKTKPGPKTKHKGR